MFYCKWLSVPYIGYQFSWFLIICITTQIYWSVAEMPLSVPVWPVLVCGCSGAAGRVHQSDRFPPEDELSPAAASQTGSLIKQTFPLHSANTTNNKSCVLHRHPARYTSSLWPISLSQHRLHFLCWLNIYGALQHTPICTSTPQQLWHWGGFWVFPWTFYKSPELSKTWRKHFIIISA